jgi:hypothetical protein
MVGHGRAGDDMGPHLRVRSGGDADGLAALNYACAAK